MRVLITGGKGYLGGRLCAYLSAQGHNITVTSRSNKDTLGLQKVSITQVSQETDLTSLLSDIDVVIHLAALDAQQSAADPIQANDVNINGTIKWLDAASSASVSKFVYFSTTHVYGNVEGNVSELTRAEPNHPYSISHKTAEDYVLRYGRLSKLDTIVFRLSNAVGYPHAEMNQWSLLVPDICKQLVSNQKFTLKSNPLAVRDFIPVADVCQVVNAVVMESADFSNGVYNLCSGINTTLQEMVETINHIYSSEYGEKGEIIYLSERTSINACTYENDKLISTGVKLDLDFSNEIKGLLAYCSDNK